MYAIRFARAAAVAASVVGVLFIGAIATTAQTAAPLPAAAAGVGAGDEKPGQSNDFDWG
ncbi:hypothetical protein ACFU6I_39010 [Streptomyces sp. NPDC057486]|uniref:hypothetical protein n=1 Tax=Streptomyces sp. NPDC057486 TaxID=3346145 RepID=UPI003691FFF0